MNIPCWHTNLCDYRDSANLCTLVNRKKDCYCPYDIPEGKKDVVGYLKAIDEAERIMDLKKIMRRMTGR